MKQQAVTSPTPPAAWSAVVAMSLGAFALVASEFMPVSLLTPVARDLHMSEGRAGQAIAVSGAFALVTSLFISTIARRVDRKRLLLGLTALMMASGTVAAFAPSATLFMIGRALVGMAIGGFWSLSAATAIRLVPERDVPRALAIVNGGNALATVIAAPLGSFLGAAVGWRWAFFSTVPIAAIALAWKAVSLPSMKSDAAGRASDVFAVFRLVRRPRVAWGAAAASLFFMGQFALFTYLRPFLESVTQVGASLLSVMLLVVGAAGFVGTTLIGRVLGRSLHRTLVAIPLVMAAVAVLLMVFGSSVIATALLLGVWGFVGTAAPVAWWTWVARTMPRDAEAGGGLLVAVVQLAIGLGATLGGLAFDASGYRATFGMSAALLLVAAAVATAAARAAAAAPSRDDAKDALRRGEAAVLF